MLGRNRSLFEADVKRIHILVVRNPHARVPLEIVYVNGHNYDLIRLLNEDRPNLLSRVMPAVPDGVEEEVFAALYSAILRGMPRRSSDRVSHLRFTGPPEW